MKGTKMIHPSDLTTGDVVSVIPIGALAEVKYNAQGVISGIYVALENEEGDPSYEKLDSSISSFLQKSGKIPSRLSRPGETSVYGVFTCSPINPYDIERLGSVEYVMNKIRNKDERVSFAAYSLKSREVVYGAHNQNSTMRMMGFEACKSFVASSVSEMNQGSIDKTFAMQQTYPFVSAYCIAKSNGDFRLVDSGVSFHRVENVQTFFNQSGYVMCEVLCNDSVTYIWPYSSVVRCNVQKGSIVAVDEGKVTYCSDSSNGSKRVDREIRCPYCNSLIVSSSFGYVTCPYENCVSRMYPSVEKLFRTLDLEPMPYVDFEQYVNSGKIQSICDVLNLPEFAQREVQCTLGTLIKSLVPVHVRVSSDFFDRFVENAGSTDAVVHYLENPDEISIDMSKSIDSMSISNFSEWISSPENLLVVKTFMNAENVSIIENSINLGNVPLIFRNKTMYLEGEFRRGSYSYIASILKSYGAEIASKFDNRCSCLIVGGFVRDAEKRVNIDIAKSYSIPVFDEDTLFNMYGIDQDIASN